MNQIQRVIFCKGAVETLGYFSEQLSDAIAKDGYETFLFDFSCPRQSRQSMLDFIIPGKTALITFNFIGLSEEPFMAGRFSSTLWDELDIQVINILVDHPIYYHQTLLKPLPKDFTLFCVDEDHVVYIHTYYPFVTCCHYLPLAGTMATPCPLPIEARPLDLVFAANYVRTDPLITGLKKLDTEYQDFYLAIVEDLKQHPHEALEPVMKRHIQRELPDLTLTELRDAMHGMVFLDLYIRTYFRGQVIKALTNAGIPVFVIGKDWDCLECSHPELIHPLGNGMEDSAFCLKQLANAKIGLNVMPWFKRGLHDRIPNSQLQGAVSLSDTHHDQVPSRQIEDGIETGQLLYSLDQLEDLPELVTDALSHPNILQDIADTGNKRARHLHTWKQRATILLDALH